MRLFLILLIVLSSAPVHARAGGPGAGEAPGDLLVRALSNQQLSYIATRTSIFWSDNGQTRALIARVYKDGNRVRYEYPARGNRPPRIVIETENELYFIRPKGDHTLVTTAHREHDPDIDGVRVKLAMSNYQWKYEPSSSPRRRVVAAWRPGAEYPSQRFWIALTPMAVVRAERYGPRGELHSSWSLDSMRVVSSLQDRLFTPPHGPDLELRDATMPQTVKLEDVKEKVKFEPVQIPEEKIPEGYKLVEICIEQMSGPTKRNAVRFVYSDGLDSFSLLETKKVVGSEKIRGTHSRDVNILDTTAQVFTSAEANLVHWQDQARLYTLMGSLSPRVLVDMSRAVIAMSVPPRPRRIVATPAVALETPRNRGFGEILSRGWNRLVKMLGL